jgi:uncharacterized cupredoxin-like copper-binding protein
VQDIRIAAQDFRFDPSQILVSAQRPVRIRIVNEGREIHEFASSLLTHPDVRIRSDERSDALNHKSVRILPGHTATLIIQAPPGVYLFRCLVRGHAGMNGTLIME